MSSEEVIELSIDETNDLRAKLGLKPLRHNTKSSKTTNPLSTTDKSNVDANDTEELSLSVQDTNALRAKLGLKLLQDTSTEQIPTGKSSNDAIHVPAQNKAKQQEIEKRVEDAKLKRQVEDGILRMQQISQGQDSSNGGVDKENGVLSWAEKMRLAKQNTDEGTSLSSKIKTSTASLTDYTSNDLKGKNISIAHSSNDFQAGSSTILTLADQSILDEEGKYLDGNSMELENVNMTEQNKTNDNLKLKRQMEMGKGHEGGYTGYDDDEFEELGGSQSHSTTNASFGGDILGTKSRKKIGFQLDHLLEEQEMDTEIKSRDLFASRQSISLKSENGHAHQSDFMTVDEDSTIARKQIEKAKKKQKKLFKKLKKANKKGKKRRITSEKDISDSEEGENPTVSSSTGVRSRSLLEDLEENTHVQSTTNRKRLRDEEDITNDERIESSTKKENDDTRSLELRKNKYHRIMEKGNTRTKQSFKLTEKKDTTTTNDTRIKPEDDHVEDDDAQLSLALSKAKRLNRLRDLHAKNSKFQDQKAIAKGADAVVESIWSLRSNNKANGVKMNENDNGITFEVDATKEFTQFLRSSPKSEKTTYVANISANTPSKRDSENVLRIEKGQPVELTKEDEELDEDTLEKLAHEVEDDKNDLAAGFGSTASTAPVGRGLANVLSMLKHTGEITGKHAGKEELRGRAKDKRTYEDYEALDLKKVVKIDSRNKKDLELADREIKLEYRDAHGRLLTRKDAYRNLCYQFHGHGSSKKNEEKRLRQIERERSERTVASKQGGTSHNGSSNEFGTLGALKATQKATGKAFVLHKI